MSKANKKHLEMEEIRKTISDFWNAVKEQKEIMWTSGKRKKGGKDRKRKKKKTYGEKEKGMVKTDTTRKREHAPTLGKKVEDICKVTKLTINTEEKRDNKITEHPGPATVAAARESSSDHNEG